MYQIGQWVYWNNKGCECKVLNFDNSWGLAQYEVWSESFSKPIIALEDELQPLSNICNLEIEAPLINYVSNATQIDYLLSSNKQTKLVSPARASIRPLPHQIAALKKITSKNPIRFLLADEVGLGKTIEAGLVIEELKLRGLAKRILVVVPKGLASQWIDEMKNRFGEEFQLINGNEIDTLDRLFVSEGGTWKQFNQVIISQDAIKPLKKRRGWDNKRIEEYNQTRLGNLLKAGWDLVIIDEAHRLGGSTDQVARYQLGKHLSETAPNMLMLSATPHQGKTDAFFRLMNILDDRAFPDESSVNKETIAPFLVRTEKRNAINEKGEQLFNKRETVLVPVKWDEWQEHHKALYEEVSSYARNGYNKAKKDKKPQVGFLMILLQRLVSSSTAALKATLSRRLEVLETDKKERIEQPSLNLDELEDMDGEELADVLIDSKERVLAEQQLVRDLIDLSIRAEYEADDAKITSMLNLVSSVISEENDFNTKFLVFTEFVPTQYMIKEHLERRNFSVCVINGSMTMEERIAQIEKFRNEASFLISTDAGGEGLNMQFAHIVINYDLPWNPMKIEQRIGRVDRIGQPKTVKAFNLLLNNTVEYRVQRVLEIKLHTVAMQLGVDKTSDVLNSSDASEAYQNALVAAFMTPDKVEEIIEKAVKYIKETAKEDKKSKQVLTSISDKPTVDDIKDIMDNPLPELTEKMVVSYLLSHDGIAEHKDDKWNLKWKDSISMKNVSFINADSEIFLSTKDEQVSQLYKMIPEFHKGRLVPKVNVEGLPEGLKGTWGLFKIEIKNKTSYMDMEYLQVEKERKEYMPLFLSYDGRIFKPTANRLWTLLQNHYGDILGYHDERESIIKYQLMYKTAISFSDLIIEDYKVEQEEIVKKEISRLSQYDMYQQSQIENTGLDTVRKHRQMKLGLYNDQIEAEIKAYKQILPKLSCMMLVSVGD